MKKLHSIQMLRAVAAGLVVLDHALGSGMTPIWPSKGIVDFAYFLGMLGVYIFFVISGFIMMHSQYDEFEALGAPQKFFVRRFVRVVPYYWLITLITLPYLYHKGQPRGGGRHC